MSDRLREVMRELAEEATPASPRSDTWRRGRRSHLLRVAGAALATALVAGAGVAGWRTDAFTSSPQPTSTSYDPHSLAIPDRIWKPSPVDTGD